MNRTLDRFLPIAYGLLSITSVQGYGDSNIETRIGQLETDMKKISSETAYGNLGSRTASANPQIDGFGFFTTADLLFWKLYEGGTDYLFKSENDRAAFPIKGDIEHFNFDWGLGFKFGGGYLFEHDGWDVDAELTYFQTHAHHSSSAHLPHLFPLVGDRLLNLTHSTAHFKVHFYNVDLVLGRNYFVGKFLSLHPFFGLSSAWIDQHRHFHFQTDTRDHVALRSKNDFWGIGPRLGLGAQFAFCQSFSFYADIFGNLLWGDFRVSEWEKNKTLDLVYYDLHDNLHRMVPNAAFGLGLLYETNLSQDTCHLIIKGGYENQYWWRQNQLLVPDVDNLEFYRASDDLSMQGLTLQFRLDF
jgi:hypothetical protein